MGCKSDGQNVQKRLAKKIQPTSNFRRKGNQKERETEKKGL